MPFTLPYNDYYNHLIRPSLVSMGFRVIRGDEIYGNGIILNDIFQSIIEAHIVLVDISLQSPNVCYELGIAHTLQKKTILISHNIEEIAFDYRHIRCIEYNPASRDWENDLTNKLERAVYAVNQSKDSTFNIDSLIDHFKAQLEVRMKKMKRVFIVSSTFTSSTFFSELLKSLISRLEQNGFIPDIRLPQFDFDNVEIKRHTQEAIENSDLYIGGFLIHSNPDENIPFFTEQSRKFGKPIIFLDARESDDYSLFPKNCSFVGFNNSAIGTIASNFAYNLFTVENQMKPKILVIGAQLQSNRQKDFISEIQKRIPLSTITLDDSGNFNRRKAYKILSEKISNLRNRKEDFYDLIFCTNDEMALGCIHCIQDHKNFDSSNYKIIGVDGIKEATFKINESKSNFIATVNQNLDILILKGIDILLKKIRMEHTETFYLLNPEIYTNEG